MRFLERMTGKIVFTRPAAALNFDPNNPCPDVCNCNFSGSYSAESRFMFWSHHCIAAATLTTPTKITASPRVL